MFQCYYELHAHTVSGETPLHTTKLCRVQGHDCCGDLSCASQPLHASKGFAHLALRQLELPSNFPKSPRGGITLIKTTGQLKALTLKSEYSGLHPLSARPWTSYLSFLCLGFSDNASTFHIEIRQGLESKFM